MSPQPGRELRRWFDLELRLLLLGAEERRRPGLRLFRDRARPRVWDRQLTIAGSAPEPADLDLRALDAFYREGDVEQWSLVALAGGGGEAWENELVPRGLVGERVHLMARAPRRHPVRSDLLALEGAGFERLVRLLAALTESAGASIAAQVIGVVAERARHGFRPRVLAIEEKGEIVASITLTPAGERVWLEDLMVHPACRRKGLGRELFQAAENEAHLLGAAAVGFSASAAEWTAGWYARDGFAMLGEVVRLRRLL